MRNRTRAAGVCAALIVALTGSGVAAAGTAEASTPTALVPAELGGLCGTLVGGGLTAAQVAKTIAQRGAGYAGTVIAAGCLTKDYWDYKQTWIRTTPEGRRFYEEMRASFGDLDHVETGQLMQKLGCVAVAVPPVNADDISTYGGVTWDCSTSQWTKGD